MIITIVADVLGQENNGTTIVCMNLVRYLKSRGDEVRILTSDKDKAGMEGYYIVPVYNLGFILNYMLKINNVELAKPDKRIIKEALTGSDLCHVIIPFALGIQAAKMAREMNIPLTCGFHCQAENFTSHLFLMNSRLANYLTYFVHYHKLYKFADAIHYPTKFIKDYFEKTINVKTNGYVISNGVNDIFKPTKQEIKENDDIYRVLYIGRYSREKSHNVLIKAIAKSKYKDKIELILAGQGPKEKQIKKLAKKLKINCPIMKFYSRERLVDVINSSTIYCHVAEVEIEAISCLEAISCGLVPIIANSKRSATKAFALDNRSLFKVNDSADLARKIDYLLEHKDERMELKEKYLSVIDKYDQTECMNKMREMMVEVINEKRRKSNLLQEFSYR
ncbi:glycosyltransferase [bacterium]|nr:glycosyltransferase [bacterium]